MSTTNRSTGRRFFSAAIFELIVTRAEERQQTILEICTQDRSLPSPALAYSEIYGDAALAERYAEVMKQRKLSGEAV
jgi:hypothetical protein